MKSFLLTTVVAVVLVSLGIGAGYLWAAKNLAGAAAEPDSGQGTVSFDARTLANLGVEVQPAKLGQYLASREFHAVVASPPLAARPLTAELPGVVTAVAVEPGGVVAAGGALVTILRDAIPRPKLELTAAMFRPVSETLHDAFASLRTAVRRRQIARAELDRVKKLNGGGGSDDPPVISRQTVVNLEYELTRADEAYHNAHAELLHHGLSDKEIEAVVGGAHPPHGRDLWRRLLQVHSMWTDDVEKIHESLPKQAKAESFVVAVLGELVAQGLMTPKLVDAVTAHEDVREHFLEVASLLLQGETLPRIERWAKQGALASVYVVQAPEGAVRDWDVGDVAVRPGQRVTLGAPLLTLHDPRRMWLRIQLLGDEVPVALEVLKQNVALTAVPLLPGTGPDLADLRLLRIVDDPATAGGGAALVECRNQPLSAGSPSGSRSWQLRDGMRYVVRMPTRSYEKIYVFAKDAVARQGVDRVVFLRDGASFRAQPVRVVYEDATTVLVAHDGAVFPNDSVVTRGGFVIGVAMQQGSGGGGHGHSHPH